METRARVIVIGMDGATWDLLGPWMKEGMMPNLAWLVREGASGGLMSTPNPSSAPAWSSFMTGKNPGKHGVFSFTSRASDGTQGWVSSRAIKARKLWHYLGEHGRKVCTINVPLSYPPEEVNGFMMCDFLTPPGAPTVSYPADFYATLVREIGAYLIQPRDDLNPGGEYFKSLKEATKNRHDALCYMLDNHDLDFLMLVFEAPDRIQHKAFKCLDPKEPEYNLPYSPFLREKAMECFAIIDNALGSVVKRLRENDCLFIVSDHGFGALKGWFLADNWLSDIGLLKFSRVTLAAEKLARRFGLVKSEPAEAIEFLRVKARQHNAIRWQDSLAFTGHISERALHINRRAGNGRSPLKGSDYETVLDFLRKEILEVKDPSGAKAVAEAVRPAEIYHGPYVSEAPDLIVNMRDPGVRMKRGISVRNRGYFQLENSPQGDHLPEGILVAWGKNVCPGSQINGASIMDMAPTILHTMGLPVPEDMDGQVLAGLYDSGFLARNPVVRSSASNGEYQGESGDVYSEDDAAAIHKRLAALGYVD